MDPGGSWAEQNGYAWLEMADALSIYAAKNLTLCKFQDGCGWCELATNPISLILLTSLVMFSSFTCRSWKKVTYTLDLPRRWRGENMENIETAKERKKERQRERERGSQRERREREVERKGREVREVTEEREERREKRETENFKNREKREEDRKQRENENIIYIYYDKWQYIKRGNDTWEKSGGTDVQHTWETHISWPVKSRYISRIARKTTGNPSGLREGLLPTAKSWVPICNIQQYRVLNHRCSLALSVPGVWTGSAIQRTSGRISGALQYRTCQFPFQIEWASAQVPPTPLYLGGTVERERERGGRGRGRGREREREEREGERERERERVRERERGEGEMDGWIDGWGWMDGWMDGWTDGWMDG